MASSGSQFPSIVLKPGREKAVLRRHPWIYSGAIQNVKGEPGGGDLVVVRSAGGEFLGTGSFSPHSQIRCRMWAFGGQVPTNPEEELDGLIEPRIRAAILRRESDPNLNDTNACRLVHAESDLLPGLIVDRYGKTLVVQFLSYGVEKERETIIRILEDTLAPEEIYERSDADVRELEGLAPRSMALKGNPDHAEVDIEENGIRFQVNLLEGHKTGFYLDQRENRQRLREFCAGKEVLDCFCYTGGFTLNALRAGAKTVTSVDESENALDLLSGNAALNGFSSSRLELLSNDVFKQLRLFRDQGRSFDVIILDPPKFAPTRQQVKSAARGYKDINLLAAKLLNPEGVLFTFSCSGGVDAALFQQIVAGAALDAGVDMQVIGRMSQASDHPVLLSFPEGEYLKGLITQRLS